jgi:hypothetical protein
MRWGKPVLAIALYVLACFALLPALHTFSQGASAWVIAGMCAFSLLFAAVIYYLYRPDVGRWPEWTVRMVAISWVGLSAMAIFYRPDVSQDLTIADATTSIGELFAEEDAQATGEDIASLPDGNLVPASSEDTAPVTAPTPADFTGLAEAPVLTSGVRVGVLAKTPTPDYRVPSSVLPEVASGQRPHGIVVRPLDSGTRMNESGREIQFETADLMLAVQHGPAPVTVTRTGEIEQAAVDLPEGEAGLPKALLGSKVDPPDQIAVLAGEQPTIPSQGLAPAVQAALDERPFYWELTGLADRGVPAVFRAASVPDQDGGDWIADGVPVLQGAAPASPDLIDAAWDLVAVASSTVSTVAPSRLSTGRNPDPVQVTVLRTGRDDWMQNQVARLGEPSSAGPVGAASAGDRPELPLSDANALSQKLATAKESPGNALQGPAVLTSTPSQSVNVDNLELPPQTDGDPIAARIGKEPEAGATPSNLILASGPSGLPNIPATQPPPMAERVLIYLYFDDPRLGSHPTVGDPWQALVSPELADAVERTEVEEVREIVAVTNWCAAANDPDGVKQKTLPGGAYTTAILSDRIRLLKVRVDLPNEKLGLLEAELPVFDGAEPGFFHNKMPLMGGQRGEPVLARAVAYLRESSNAGIDLNTPPGIEGGHYYASTEALMSALKAHGCVGALFNQGEGPSNEIGRIVSKKLGG